MSERAPSPTMIRLAELQQRAHERRRLLERAKQSLDFCDYSRAIQEIVRVVEMLSHAEETVIQLHGECFAMIETAKEVLRLDAERRPVQIIMPKEG